jgi:hypothetical protein
MALTKEFEKDLEKLFHRRTAWLRRAIGKKRPGPAPMFTKAKVSPRLMRLTEIAREILLRGRGKKEFWRSLEFKCQWFPKKGKGFGIHAKKLTFNRWYDRRIGTRNCVYVFWSNGICEYVGRTVRGKGRPVGWFDKFWFQSVTRIDIYGVRIPSLVPKAECLAIDRFNPRRNIYSASRPKRAKKCPVCRATREIRKELKDLFRLR